MKGRGYFDFVFPLKPHFLRERKTLIHRFLSEFSLPSLQLLSLSLFFLCFRRIERLLAEMAGILRLRTIAQSLVRKFGLDHQRRSFGAAALQVDYEDEEDYYDDEYEFNKDQNQLMVASAESKGSISERGVQWVFIGNPTAKKHLYAERLSKLLEVPHISMGSLVRQELNPRSSLYKQVYTSCFSVLSLLLIYLFSSQNLINSYLFSCFLQFYFDL